MESLLRNESLLQLDSLNEDSYSQKSHDFNQIVEIDKQIEKPKNTEENQVAKAVDGVPNVVVCFLYFQ